MSGERIRDGISQKMRLKAALQPDYISVDERSLEDMLRFLYEYSAGLRYFDENNRENGTWQDFFPFPSNEVAPNEALSDIKKFLENPASLSEDKVQKYQQPHFVLLLTFLKLLERVKQHLNGFTKKHLDFYFQNILRMQKKKARLDQVNVLIELAKQHESFSLPAGTQLHAGKDSAGKSLTYKTDEDTQLNHARIAQLRAVYIDKKNLSFQKIYEENENNSAKAIWEMFVVVLGDVNYEMSKNIEKLKLAIVLGKIDSQMYENILNLKKKEDIEANFHMSEKDFILFSSIAWKNKAERHELDLIYKILSSARQKKLSKDLAKLLASEKEQNLLARRKRESQEDIIAEKEEWQGLYAYEDVRTVVVKNDIDSNDNEKRWKTFGQFFSEEKIKLHHVPAEFGLAISAPVLLLSQGKRTITLIFNLNNGINLTKEMFSVFATTEKGWIEASDVTIKEKNLIMIIEFTANQEPIAAPKYGYFKGIDWPIIKIISDNRNKNSAEYYKQLKKEILSNISIDVEVNDFSDFNIWNDFQELDCKKPFEPFGPKPIVGSRFYLSSSELQLKKITEIIFKNDWVNIEHLSDTYYQAYNIYNAEKNNKNKKIEGGKSFKVLIQTDIIQDNKEYELFKKNDDGYCISFSKDGHVKEIYWELQNPDFQHSVYPALAAEKASELAVVIANENIGKKIDEIKKISTSLSDNKINIEEKNKLIERLAELTKTTQPLKAEDYFVNPPFTPVIKKLTLNYKATAKLSDNQNDIKLFHIHPFGYAEVTPLKEGGKIIKYPSFLPQYDRAGELYIGLENLKPPQHLSMLFQMAEGSADANMNPSPVYWDYLDGNEWQPLENGGVLQDGTRGLINSGIIKFALPAAENPSTLLPPELYWLRASVRKRPNSVCDTVAIHTQAVAATLVDNDNAPDHFTKPLAEETIKKLLHPHPAIKAVHQPYTSFGGKTAEEDKLFYTRVSERLRHKQRALTVWDYEHLVLERFPQIYKVKCIPANASRPGSIDIVVIPDICNRLPADPFEPKAPVNVLTDIQEYLQGIAPDSANIVVKNAHYVHFQIRMGVRFRQGYEEGYHANRLQDTLNRFLAPWAYTEGADIVFGGKIYASSIINFVERLPYVDYIAKLIFFPGKFINGESSISAKEAADVLVPERKHVIDAIPEGGYQFGINHMMIGLDFQVA